VPIKEKLMTTLAITTIELLALYIGKILEFPRFSLKVGVEKGTDTATSIAIIFYEHCVEKRYDIILSKLAYLAVYENTVSWKYRDSDVLIKLTKKDDIEIDYEVFTDVPGIKNERFNKELLLLTTNAIVKWVPKEHKIENPKKS